MYLFFIGIPELLDGSQSVNFLFISPSHIDAVAITAESISIFISFSTSLSESELFSLAISVCFVVLLLTYDSTLVLSPSGS